MADSARPRRKNRRRGQKRQVQFDSSIPSPCLSVCRFDGEPFCRGCYRNQDEIREWIIMTREQKIAVLDRVALRRKSETGETAW